MTTVDRPESAASPRQELNLRWLAILVATALLAGTAGYIAAGGPSRVFVLTADAQSGVGQVSAQAPDGRSYGIPVTGIWWTDSRGSLHDNDRAECLPAAGKRGTVKFAAVEWTAAGMTQRSVVWVECRS